MTYIKVSVPKPGNNAGVGGDKKSLITFFDFEDVLTYPSRDSKGIVMTDNITLKEGAYMIQVYASTKSIKINQDPEGEEDARGIIQKLEFAHPGSENGIEEFLANWMNRDIGCVVENCSTNKKRQLGTPCAPLELSPASEDSNEMNKSTLTLTSKNKSPFRVADYQGTLTYEDVTDTVDDGDTSIDLSAGEGRYQLSDNSSATEITTCINATNGMVFTLLGSGGTNPSSITAGNDFILASGTSWSAIAGAEITFKAMKSGASEWSFIEISRS